ncbi:COMM domain-containing protein 4-like [Stegodyphus dumicola]|uniref:COMM domain-containing protein 4-like n=1 Tax=Stegodyphus dumicola TaxID=202533 RepID=UPI0015B26907|nr:COMM domain-containing protein 4-like [Stegodyphus dumicola]
MKFRFCGELDCPDWVLAEIATLSRISSIKMKLLCTQVVNGILGTPIDFDKVNKLTADAKYEKGDVKATIAALTFIFTSSSKHAIDEDSLLNELQQLGLPKGKFVRTSVLSMKFNFLLSFQQIIYRV